MGANFFLMFFSFPICNVTSNTSIVEAMTQVEVFLLSMLELFPWGLHRLPNWIKIQANQKSIVSHLICENKSWMISSMWNDECKFMNVNVVHSRWNIFKDSLSLSWIMKAKHEVWLKKVLFHTTSYSSHLFQEFFLHGWARLSLINSTAVSQGLKYTN